MPSCGHCIQNSPLIPYYLIREIRERFFASKTTLRSESCSIVKNCQSSKFQANLRRKLHEMALPFYGEFVLPVGIQPRRSGDESLPNRISNSLTVDAVFFRKSVYLQIFIIDQCRFHFLDSLDFSKHLLE